MSIKAMTWVWEHSPEKSTRLLLLLAIADHCDDEGVCYPSVARLAKKCRVGVRRVQQVIEALKRTGELGVAIGRGVEFNGGKTNRYYLNGYRQSLGLQPVTSAPVADSLLEERNATFPEEFFEEAGEALCTDPPEEDCQISARTCEAPPPAVCVGERDSLEQEALRWASSHPFWSTRITNRAALRRNLATGKSFRAQFLAARAAADTVRAPPGGYGEHHHAAHLRSAHVGNDYHTAFWQRFGGAVHGRLLDPDGGH